MFYETKSQDEILFRKMCVSIKKEANKKEAQLTMREKG